MELYLIRHTSVKINKGICYGHSNVDVADTFNSEVDKIAKQIKSIKFNKVYSSPAKRCTKLAKALFSNITFITDKRLLELNFGDWEGKTWDEIFKLPMGKQWMDNFVAIPCPNGESFLNQISRVSNFYNEIESKHTNNKIAIVCHSGTIRSFQCIMQGLEPINAFKTEIKYGEILTMILSSKTMNIQIPEPALHLKNKLQHKLDNKAKPVGSLGKLEDIALRIGMIQHTLTPALINPVMLTVAADHNITEEGVSPCPVEITWQQVNNFLVGGGGIGLFAKLYGMNLFIADAGVNYDFKPHPKLIDVKIKKGTANFLHQHAMSMEECLQAIQNGRDIVNKFHKNGTNIMGFGEMGIGNTTPASALLSIFCNIPIQNAVGPGSGLNKSGIDNKAKVIQQAFNKHGISENAVENLARFGGLEIATLCGAMLQAAQNKMVIISDGYITTSALLVAQAINPKVLDYSFFSHQSKEQGHKAMIKHMKGDPILDLNLRLGEGTGAALAYSIIKGAVAVLSEMTSFEESQVTNTSHIKFKD